MKVTVKGNEIIIEAQRPDEDAIILDMFNTGNISALGELNNGRKQLILTMAVPRRV
ncbi:MAG: hypothetical protein PHV11_06945 [Candidatus Bipolaricaulis sp.]|nr:hypothetical protein [Candidatus Bipolaricaulis sp.]